jgi:hypothetical protein
MVSGQQGILAKNAWVFGILASQAQLFQTKPPVAFFVGLHAFKNRPRGHHHFVVPIGGLG